MTGPEDDEPAAPAPSGGRHAAPGSDDDHPSAVMGQPPQHEPEIVDGEVVDGEILDAEIIDEPPQLGEFTTDEWEPVPPPPTQRPAPGPAGPPRPPLRSGPRPPLGASRPLAPPPRPLGPPPRPRPATGPAPHQPASTPGVFVADQWETAPLPAVPAPTGRRRPRLRTGSRPSTAGWLVVFGVVLSLSAAVAVPFIITGNAPDLLGDEDSLGGPSYTPYPGSLDPQNSMPVIATAPSVTPSASATASASASASRTPTATASSGPALFSTTLEAESGNRSGCAQTHHVDGASGNGNNVVDQLGTGWQCYGPRGVVTFSLGNLPAGQYTITVHYVFDFMRQYDDLRWARLRLDPSAQGQNNIDITPQGGDYARGCAGNASKPCLMTRQFTVTVPNGGAYAVSFTNERGGYAPQRAPALDKIVIAQTAA